MSKELALIQTGKDLISFDEKKTALIRNSVAKDLNQIEFDFFISVARARGLDPILNQIHAVKRKVKVSKNPDKYEERMTIQVGIDGFRLIAARTSEYAGCDRTIFDFNEKNELLAAEVTVYRLVQGQRCAFTAVADWDEFFPGEVQGFMWKAKPKTMLGKCAEAQALRKAFPNDLAGLYEPAELEVREVVEKTEELSLKEVEAKREARVDQILQGLSYFGVSTKMIGEKYKISGRDELTDEMLKDLVAIGNSLKADRNRKQEFFPVKNYAPKGA
jgi:phage recombination protein Bet